MVPLALVVHHAVVEKRPAAAHVHPLEALRRQRLRGEMVGGTHRAHPAVRHAGVADTRQPQARYRALDNDHAGDGHALVAHQQQLVVAPAERPRELLKAADMGLLAMAVAHGGQVHVVVKLAQQLRVFGQLITQLVLADAAQVFLRPLAGGRERQLDRAVHPQRQVEIAHPLVQPPLQAAPLDDGQVAALAVAAQQVQQLPQIHFAQRGFGAVTGKCQPAPVVPLAVATGEQNTQRRAARSLRARQHPDVGAGGTGQFPQVVSQSCHAVAPVCDTHCGAMVAFLGPTGRVWYIVAQRIKTYD